jgi:hypothetical protein
MKVAAPAFGQAGVVGSYQPPVQQSQPVVWNFSQTADFFTPQAVQEAHRQAAWQQFYQVPRLLS